MKKNKSFLILLVILLGTNSAYSEEALQSSNIKRPVYTLTPEIGSTSFHVVGLDSKYISGSSIGTSVRFTTAEPSLSWSIGAQYFQTGLKKTFDLGIFSIDLAKVKMDYLGLPIKAEYLINHQTENKVNYYFNAGATPAYLLSANQQALYGDDTKEHGIRSAMNGFDMLLNAGMGGRYVTDLGVMEASFEYNHGLFNVDKESKNSTKNEGFIAKIGYVISM